MTKVGYHAQYSINKFLLFLMSLLILDLEQYRRTRHKMNETKKSIKYG